MEPVNFMELGGTGRVSFRAHMWDYKGQVYPATQCFYVWPLNLRGALVEESIVTHELRSVGPWNH